jgi:hypothetical protein
MPDKDNQSFDEKNIVFRYSRERRLANASETVRKLSEEGKKHSFNLLRPLTATKSLTFLFVSIIVLLVLMYIISFFFGVKKEIVLGGNSINVSAFTFEGKTYLTLNKKIQNKNDFYTGTIDLAISPSDNSPDEASPDDTSSDDASTDDNAPEQSSDEIKIHTGRIFFTSEPDEDFKMAIPFEAERLLILIQSEKEMQTLHVVTE